MKQSDAEIVIPDNMVELQYFCSNLWEGIFEADTADADKIKLYNTAAKKYNKQAGADRITIIDNFKKQKQMAVKKPAAKKAAPKKAVKKAAPKKAAAKKAAAPKADGEKKVSQKTQIVALADAGKTIDEVVEITGIKKTNVAWYFSKLGLNKKK